MKFRFDSNQLLSKRLKLISGKTGYHKTHKTFVPPSGNYMSYMPQDVNVKF